MLVSDFLHDSVERTPDKLTYILRNCEASAVFVSNIDVGSACLIYTSGSTGDPKSVMSTHANVAFRTSLPETASGKIQRRALAVGAVEG